MSRVNPEFQRTLEAYRLVRRQGEGWICTTCEQPVAEGVYHSADSCITALKEALKRQQEPTP